MERLLGPAECLPIRSHQLGYLRFCATSEEIRSKRMDRDERTKCGLFQAQPLLVYQPAKEHPERVNAGALR